jgi:hypothetical protein
VEQLEVTKNERLDRRHIQILQLGVEKLARTVGRGKHLNAAGLLHLPSTPTYNATTRRLTLPKGLLAVDPDGNPVELSDAVESEPVAAADVGNVAPIFVWCAVEPGTVAGQQLQRVFWKEAGQEESRNTPTRRADRVRFEWGALQPPDTASGTKYFPILRYGAWTGSTPSSLQLWWVVPSWRGKLSVAQMPWGAFVSWAELVVRMFDNLLSPTPGTWDELAAGTFGVTLNELLERIVVLEEWREAHEASLDETELNVPLSGATALPTTDWTWDNGAWKTSAAGTALWLELTWPSTLRAQNVVARVSPGNTLAVVVSLYRISKLTGASTLLATETLSAGGAAEHVSLEFGTDPQDPGIEGHRFLLRLSCTGSAAATPAFLRGVTLRLSLPE